MLRNSAQGADPGWGGGRGEGWVPLPLSTPGLCGLSWKPRVFWDSLEPAGPQPPASPPPPPPPPGFGCASWPMLRLLYTSTEGWRRKRGQPARSEDAREPDARRRRARHQRPKCVGGSLWAGFFCPFPPTTNGEEGVHHRMRALGRRDPRGGRPRCHTVPEMRPLGLGPEPWEQNTPRGREAGWAPSQQSGTAFLDNEISPPPVLLGPAGSQINLNEPFVPRVK